MQAKPRSRACRHQPVQPAALSPLVAATSARPTRPPTTTAAFVSAPVRPKRATLRAETGTRHLRWPNRTASRSLGLIGAATFRAISRISGRVDRTFLNQYSQASLGRIEVNLAEMFPGDLDIMRALSGIQTCSTPQCIARFSLNRTLSNEPPGNSCRHGYEGKTGQFRASSSGRPPYQNKNGYDQGRQEAHSHGLKLGIIAG